MTIRKSIISVCAGLLLVATIHPVLAATLVIQEETARFHSDTVRYPAANTFLIVPASTKMKQACNSGHIIGNCQQLPTLHFQLGSAKLSSDEKQLLLDGLQRCAVSETTPLRVTGYTCSLGNEQENHILSLHRARAVADVLRGHGYTVKEEDVQGVGDEKPLTKEHNNFAMNRRVQIAM
jgi:outer membrane protein OmpA-like peptidoglycan-associated protein